VNSNHHKKTNTGQPPKIMAKTLPCGSLPLTDFGHYLAKKHATKIVIKQKYAPQPCVQCGQML
jgi:hypothetical protein